jgi:hypothetical protein
LLTDNLDRCMEKADAGDVQAAGAITGIIRELNAISNLHKATIVNESTPDQPIGKEAETLAGLAEQYKKSMAGPKLAAEGA